MKKLITIILTLLSTTAFGKTLYLAIASDPQFRWECITNECKQQAKSLNAQAVLSNKWQAQSINKLGQLYGSDFRGVIINGDLTAFGHSDELEGYLKYFRNLINYPVFPGLGNHDYANNINDCTNNNCAVRMVHYLDQQIRSLGTRVSSYDFKSDDDSKSFTGSLSYSYSIDNVHIVQLNNYPTYETKFRAWNFLRFRWEYYTINPSLDWLEENLKEASNLGKEIVVNLHDLEDHMTESDRNRFLDIVERYRVSAVFWGHFHESHGRQKVTRNIPGFISGSSSTNKYLLVQFVDDRLCSVSVIDAVEGGVTILEKHII